MGVSFTYPVFPDKGHFEVPLTPHTVPALAQAFIADGDMFHFCSLLHNASLEKDPTALLSPLRVSYIKTAIEFAFQPNDADAFSAAGATGSLVQIAEAVRIIPKLSAAFTPKVSAIILDRIDAGRMSDKNSSWHTSFACFAHAIADRPNRRALLKPEMVAEAAHKLAAYSHDVLNHHREPLHLYREGYAVDFFKLAVLVKHDDRLNVAIEAQDVGEVTKAILHVDLNDVKNRVLNDEGYRTGSVPKADGMKRFASFADKMADAREDWKAVIAEQIEPFIQADRDRLAGYYLGDIIEAHSYLKGASQTVPSHG